MITKDTLVTVLVTLLIGVIGTIAIIWIYFDEKPRISAVGEYAAWTIPPDRNLGGFESYAQIDVRNIGSAVAKDIKVQTPFRGILTINDKKTGSGELENDFSLPDLNPGEGYLIKIWAQNSVPDYYLNIVITHTRGTENVDFGYKAKGAVGWISKSLDIYWFAYCWLFLTVVISLWAYIDDLKKKIKNQIKEA